MPVAAAALAGLRRTLPLRIAGMLERARASAAMLYHGVVSRAAVERAHDYGAAVFAWTVDDEPTLERVIAAGVDALALAAAGLLAAVAPTGSAETPPSTATTETIESTTTTAPAATDSTT